MIEVILYLYQKEALNKWASNRYRGAIFFEPGLGKTFIVLYALTVLRAKKEYSKVLIVVPSIIIDMWTDWLVEFGFEIGKEVLVIKHGIMQKHVDKALAENKDVSIVLTTYGLFHARKYFTPDFYILDESHNIKNHKSVAYKKLNKMVCTTDKIVLLSGTPIPSGIEDFFTQLNLIKRGYLADSFFHFKMLWEYVPFKGSFQRKPIKKKLPLLRAMVTKYASFKKATRSIGLPPVTYRIKKYAFDFVTASYMDKIRTEARTPGDIFVEAPVTRMLMMMQMCSGYIHMNIIDPEAARSIFNPSTGTEMKIDSDTLPRIQIDELISEKTPKEEILLREMEDLYNLNHHMLIWVNFLHTSKRLMELFEKEKVPYLDKVAVITGKTSQKKRKEILALYDKGDLLFILAHPKTLGTGLNQFAKNTQYITWYEMSPDFALVEQANGRIYRKGQKEPVFITYYVARGRSVEERIKFIIDTKASLKDIMFKKYLGVIKKAPN